MGRAEEARWCEEERFLHERGREGGDRSNFVSNLELALGRGTVEDSGRRSATNCHSATRREGLVAEQGEVASLVELDATLALMFPAAATKWAGTCSSVAGMSWH